MRVPTRRFRALAAAVLAGAALVAVHPAPSHAGSLPLVVNGKHVLWSMGNTAPTDEASANNMIFHGGLVETKPAVYIVYWGPQWAEGFQNVHNTITYTSSTVMTYVNNFFANIGGGAWAGVQTQYCDNIQPGFSCTGQAGAQYISNPTGQLQGTWIDPSPVPSTIATTALAENVTNDPLATEALRAAQHFGYNINATYMIFTPPGITATAYGTVYCAYHAETQHTPTTHGVRYAFIPYVPEQGSGCGVDSVNADDAYGHGYLDGYSIVAGHEYAEAVTDPDNFNGTQDGWNDAQTSENGDKCAWTGLQNITVNGGYTYAVQPLWSNEAAGGQGACAVSR